MDSENDMRDMDRISKIAKEINHKIAEGYDSQGNDRDHPSLEGQLRSSSSHNGHNKVKSKLYTNALLWSLFILFLTNIGQHMKFRKKIYNVRRKKRASDIV